MDRNATVPSPAPPTVDPSHRPGGDMTVLYICAGVGGGVFALVLLAVIVLFLRRRRRNYGGSFGYSECVERRFLFCVCVSSDFIIFFFFFFFFFFVSSPSSSSLPRPFKSPLFNYSLYSAASC
jgi:hypothetical protein